MAMVPVSALSNDDAVPSITEQRQPRPRLHPTKIATAIPVSTLLDDDGRPKPQCIDPRPQSHPATMTKMVAP